MSVTPTSNAHEIIRMTLRAYGLDSPRLADWALESLIAGHSIEQILLELEQQPEYKAAFPEIEARQRRSLELGLQLEPIGPSQILEYRTRAKALMHSYGLPESFYTNNQNFFDLITNDVSLDELNARLDLSSKRVANAPPEVRAVFEDVFGTDSDRALFLAFTNVDTTLPALEDMVQVAEAGGAARRFGFGLSRAEMERVADINVSYDQAVAGFRQLDASRGLFDETITETQDLTVGGEGIAAAFGMEGGARALEQRSRARTAETAGSAGSLVEQRGVTGLGPAGKR